MTTPNGPKKTNTDSSSNPPRKKATSLEDYPEAGPDDPIYKEGLQIGFVRALPPSISASLKGKVQSQPPQSIVKEDEE